MHSSTFIKLVFVLMALYGGYYWLSERSKTSRANSLITQIAEKMENHPNEGPEQAAVDSLFAILALLQEPRTEELQDTATLISEAAKTAGRLERQAELLAEIFVQNEKTLQQLGFDNQETALLLVAALAPEIQQGPWAGQKLAVSQRVSPLKGPQARFALANLLVVPEAVAAAHMPELGLDQDRLIQRYLTVGLLPR